jgi:SP family general alpha glucoside:H+ symporter-like MFS transporter
MKGNPEDAGAPVAAIDAATNRHTDLGTITDAQAATEKEHTMSLLEGIKQYPRAIGWSILFSTALVMEGYDVVLMGSFYGFPAFQKKYGDLQPDGSYELSAQWQSGLSNAMNAGQIIGLFINGIVADRYGYRKVMLASLLLTIGFISILFFAPDKKTLLIGELMLGMPLGVFQTLSVTYASEVCPTVLRVC